MIIDGNWDTAALQKALGTKVAPMVPPFSTKPQRGVVQYAGDGYAVRRRRSTRRKRCRSCAS